VQHSTWAAGEPNMVLHHHHTWLPMMVLPRSSYRLIRPGQNDDEGISSSDPVRSTDTGSLCAVKQQQRNPAPSSEPASIDGISIADHSSGRAATHSFQIW
ncbi:hypothetical protein ACLOJK_018822, partial [Asimina triloba]